MINEDSSDSDGDSEEVDSIAESFNFEEAFDEVVGAQ